MGLKVKSPPVVEGGTSDFKHRTFEEADKLMWEILRFLWSCPNMGRVHPYRMKHIRTLQENTLESIAMNQFIIIRNEDGSIRTFASYWKVNQEGMIQVREGVKPVDRSSGNLLYIANYGNKGGRQSLTQMITELRKISRGRAGVFWHSWNTNKDRTFHKTGA